MTDAAQHMAGKKSFLQIGLFASLPLFANGRPKVYRKLAFEFASRTFAYRRLVQGLSRAFSAFSSFIRQYLDKVVKADQCAQYSDDIGITANDTEELINNLRASFKCIQKAGVKLTMHKCLFGATDIDFLGRTITPAGVKPQRPRVQNVLENTIF